MNNGSAIKCEYFAEQLLVFGNEGLHVDPKSGISRHGPRSYGLTRHPNSIRVGLVGTAETIEKSKKWLEGNANGVEGDEKHPQFPGFQKDRGFFSSIQFDNNWTEQITQSEMEDLLEIKLSRERFSATIELNF